MAGAITAGFPLPARASTSAFFCGRSFLPLVCRFLPLAAGLAAADAIRAVSALAVDLRWPNDLLIGPRKTGGILVEARIHSKGLPNAVVPYAVVGIGINVHQRAFPPDLATPATSLDLEANRHIARQDLLLALLKSLQQQALALANPDAAKEVDRARRKGFNVDARPQSGSARPASLQWGDSRSR